MTLTFLYIFLLLIASHFICDFQLQTDAIAIGKNPCIDKYKNINWYYWMTAHCMTHAIGVVIVAVIFNTHPVITMCAGIFEFLTHFAYDYSKCKGYNGIHYDQFSHIFTMLMITCFIYFPMHV